MEDSSSSSPSGCPAAVDKRSAVNILITGTPGTGKTTLASALASATGFKHIDVSAFAIEQGYHEGRDEKFDTMVLDEDKVLDDMEPFMVAGGVVVDYHGSDFFPLRWFDAVIVLRSPTETLFDRLSARGYAASKVEENLSAEIFSVCSEEARDAYDPARVVEAMSVSQEGQEELLATLNNWLSAVSAAGGPASDSAPLISTFLPSSIAALQGQVVQPDQSSAADQEEAQQAAAMAAAAAHQMGM